MFRSIAALFLVAAAAAAHAEFVPNGSLFVATDSPVTATFLGTSPGGGQATNLYWSTGPGAFDFQGSGPVNPIASTPSLATGTPVYLAHLISAPSFHDCGGCGASLVTTGGGTSKMLFGEPPNPYETFRVRAGVFYNPGNVAFVGFTSKVDDPLTGDFASYPVRFSVSNVVGSMLGGGVCK